MFYERNNIKWKSPGDSLIVDFDGISNMLCLSILAMSFFMMLRWISIEENNGHETEFKVISLLELFFNTIIGTGKNPNVAAVIVIGIEPKWTKKIVDAIKITGKHVEGFSIEGNGDINTTMKASKKAQEFSQ